MRSLSVFVLATLATATLAHVTMQPNTIPPAGGYFRSAFRIPHGCSVSETDTTRYPTMKFQIQIPPAVANASTARPEMHPFWKIDITDNADGSRTLLWTATSPEYYISDAYFMELGVSMKVPEGVAGASVLFPSTQFCTNNTQSAWVETSEDAKKPAPVLTYEDECSCDGTDTSGGATIQPVVNATDTPAKQQATNAARSAAYSACLLSLLSATMSIVGGF